ncbi:ribosomal protein S18-alanine N-acetyltransferase [Rubrivivax gelatinosus]|uniref:[Ribosomal protein bS18]-alanine N-acetyltransferase n=1 Tax=Rubrivivax gelatinosus TaxID=28068 RepID=A0A4R2MFA0_RUBGE|nr:ribosomal protein S18-alanine N-acetyltransferase [Rubrivivax gelatinosus]MBK1688278.1 ribosomal-protein-alanine N-acetyltransferase [Rubrivivax gelatinosus]TCP05552.1 [SSU ribosomal protein S18P]-alanine acetyltransferase [Rubrivivax gelatinosus]
MSLPLLRAMTLADVDAVVAVEATAYEFPWTRGNFVDSLAAGYEAWVLVDAGVLVGYYIAMVGVDEMHLLNITVAPPLQRHGWGRRLLDELDARCRTLVLPIVWLEVRAGNERAISVYLRRGFQPVGRRRGYYPAAQGREDAMVMNRRVPQEAGDVV